MKRSATKAGYKSALFMALSLVTFISSMASAQQLDTLWYENWEGNWLDDWTVSSGTWEVGIPTSGPNTSHEGTRLAATILDGNYAEDQHTRLIRHTSFLVPDTSDHPRLRFWHWFSFSNEDGGYVQIKPADSTDWITLPSGHFGEGSQGYHSSLRWTRPWFDLAPYAGQAVELCFYFTSAYSWDGAHVDAGWYIDEVMVETGGRAFNNPEDWESGIDDWYADGGIWEVGTPINVGPPGAYEGSQCASTIIDSTYYDSPDSRLISPPFVVPPASNNPRLRFWHWFSFSNEDGGYVQIKPADSTDWTTLIAVGGDPGFYYGYCGGPWSMPNFPLSDYAGQAVELCFYFISAYSWDGAHVDAGWYIDSIFVQAENLGTLAGIVTCRQTGNPLCGTHATLPNGNGAISDSSGNYGIRLIEPGTYDILFSRLGYCDTTITGVQIYANQTTTLNLGMLVGIEDESNGVIPETYILAQNFPNPFNATTTISYELPRAADIKLEVYDIMGRKVGTLAEGYREAGHHQVNWDASSRSSGVYFAVLRSGDVTEKRSMVLLK